MPNKLIPPPFTEETARAKVKAAQDGWNRVNGHRKLHRSGHRKLHTWRR